MKTQGVNIMNVRNTMLATAAVMLATTASASPYAHRSMASAGGNNGFDFGGDLAAMHENAESRDFNNQLTDTDQRTYSRVRFRTDYNSSDLKARFQVGARTFWGMATDTGGNITQGSLSSSGRGRNVTNSGNSTFGVYVKEAYVNYDITSNLSVLAGRRAWTVGNGLIVGQPNWMADGRSFDGFWFDYKLGLGPVEGVNFFGTALDTQYAPPSSPGRDNSDLQLRDTYLTGALVPLKFSDSLDGQLGYYFEHRGTTNSTPNFMSDVPAAAAEANPTAGPRAYARAGNTPLATRNIHTYTSNLQYKAGAFHVAGEYDIQQGHLRRMFQKPEAAKRKIRAHHYYAEAGYAPETTYKPTVKVGYLVASGQKGCKIEDSANKYWCDEGHWSQWIDMYGNSTEYVGIMQSVYKSNLRSLSVRTTFDVNEGIQLLANWYWLNKDEVDAPAATRGGYPSYKNNATQGIDGRAEPNRNESKLVRLNGTEIGKELDLGVRVATSKNFVFATGMALFWPGDVFIDSELGKYGFVVGQWFF